MKANKKFSKDEEAVSPVIGVILMVAITVILAAVIAAFVFGMSGSLNQSPPNVSIGARSSGNDLIVTHNGGDVLLGNEWKISVVPEGDSPEYVLSNGSDTFEVGQQIKFTTTSIETPDLTNPFDFDGASWVYTETSPAVAFSAGSRYDVIVIHTPSKSKVLDTTITK